MGLLEKLEAIEEIKKMKHRYYRYVDCKQHRQLADLFTEDATTRYDNGGHVQNGREEVYSFFVEMMSNQRILSQHHGHHPEIEITSPTTATGVWYMDDTVHILDANMRVRGNGIYWDEYVKADGDWKIAHTGYERVWCVKEVLPENESRQWQSMFDEDETRKRNERIKPEGKPDLCDF
ncbi:nuclear transport factor 2 family protein [Endozoicomonas sp. OPT23]|uniref:nuclear transport factor 2 family protein n=1 Tax=Endozoicomonas sp. OPT23 TaxID=2072845 RepID=UPI0018919403|nr:nuclear transport factor 2 family protein [Endozoicomonas sp. OPT23]